MRNHDNIKQNEEKKDKFKDKYNPPKRKPTKEEERRMIGKAMEILIVSCMKNHVYRFGNEIRIQSDGGPIGLALTGEIADCFMMKWDKKVLQKCKDVGINVTAYSRFKDDIFVAAASLENGTKYMNGKLIMDEEKKAEDEGKAEDDITMEIIRQVSEDVDPMIKLTIDVPSYHKDEKISVLDLKVEMKKQSRNLISYEFFEKPTKNPKILMADSAINSSSKRTILTQECLRRFRNTKIELDESVRNEHLNKFMVKMKNAGYGQKYRMQVLNSAFNAFEKMVEEDKSGKKPLFRNRNWNKESRIQSKENKSNHWYKNSQNSEKTWQWLVEGT